MSAPIRRCRPTALGSGTLPALDNLNLRDTRLASAAAISAVYAARDGLCAW